jgi:hypothetical protein
VNGRSVKEDQKELNSALFVCEIDVDVLGMCVCAPLIPNKINTLRYCFIFKCAHEV